MDEHVSTAEWVCGYLVEFRDGGPPERIVIRRGAEQECDGTARALERLRIVKYDGARLVRHAVVFTCLAAALEDAPGSPQEGV